MKRTFVYLLGILILTSLTAMGCVGQGGQAPLTPTAINPAEVAATMMMMQLGAQATEQSVGLQFTSTAYYVQATQAVEMTAAQAAVTAQARKDAEATAQRERMDAAATEQQKRDDAATAQARKDAEATAQQGRVDISNTQSALATATWVAVTQTAIPTNDAMTAQAVIVEQALATNQVELSNLEVERQQKSNMLEALGPYLFVLTVILVAAIILLRRSRVNTIKNEETGSTEIVVFDNKKVVKPANMPKTVLNLDDDTMPDLVDPAEQAEVTRRAQAIEALRNMPSNPPNSAANLSNSVFGGQSQPRFQILNPNEAPPANLLDPEGLKAIEHDWKENGDEQ